MATLTIQELPEQERPREKLAHHGAAALSDSELIAILLRTGIQGANAVDVARSLLAHFQSLGNLSRASVHEIAKIKGIGPTKAIQLAAAFGLGQRLARETLRSVKMDKSDLVYDLLGAEMRLLQKESLKVVLLDARFHMIRIEDISLGTLNESIAHPRDIFRPALIYSAYALIVAHNHPSGDPAPSDADCKLTKRLAGAADLLRIVLFDHVILGSPGPGRMPYFSFREAGML